MTTEEFSAALSASLANSAAGRALWEKLRARRLAHEAGELCPEETRCPKCKQKAQEAS